MKTLIVRTAKLKTSKFPEFTKEVLRFSNKEEIDDFLISNK